MNIRPMPPERFDDFFAVLTEGFDACERREYKDARALFENKKYEVLLISDQGTTVGYITTWSVGKSVFIEHFVILKEYRNRGYGKEVMEFFKKDFPYILLEAEPPTGEIQRRRLGFYKRCGFHQNQQSYVQPPYREGDAAVPLVIMSYPEPLSDFDGTVAEIYRTVYGIKS